MQTLAVVIPFYQRDRGLLRRCVESVLTQTTGPDRRFLIVVVDDGSPVSLEAALAGVVVPSPHELVRLERPNGGPGAARNTALNYLGGGRPVEFVAFIDSDDLWRPDHIRRALAVLADDADFFFCDHDRWDYPGSYLDGSQPFQRWLTSPEPPFARLTPASPDAEAAYEFRPGEALQCFLQDYLAQTSTVVYRHRGREALRFDPSLRYAGEDHMFWLQLCETARAVRFTTARDVETGEGVNIWAASIGWRHPDAARRLAAAIRFRLTIYKTLALDPAGRRAADRGLARYEAEFAQVLLRRFFRAPISALKVLLPLLRMKPALALVLPARLFDEIN